MKVREGYYPEYVRNKAFTEILPHLSERQQRVYDIIHRSGPCSTEAIAEILGVYPHTITPRVKELRELGLIELAGYSMSPRSRRTVCLWKVKPQQQQLQLL